MQTAPQRARAPHAGKFPQIRRPNGTPRATTPGVVADPEHRHLPAWVRRTYGLAKPILGDLLGSLDGEPRKELEADIASLNELIGAGKFSQAWRYPELIDKGLELYERQSREKAEQVRVRRGLETHRKRVADLLGGSDVRLATDTAARLNKEIRAAATQDEIAAVEQQVRQAVTTARTLEGRRRDREISRTRARIDRSATKQAEDGEPDSWQDVLRRLHAELSAESSANGG